MHSIESYTGNMTITGNFPALQEVVAAIEKPTEDGKPVGMKGILIVEGVATGDGRKIEKNALSWGDGPWPLMAVLETTEGHDGATLVGRIDSIVRNESNQIEFAATLDGERGGEVARLVKEQMLNGISADLDDVTGTLQTANGKEISTLDDLIEADGNGEELINVALKARVRAGTITPLPAFVETQLQLVESPQEDATSGEEPELVTASVTKIESKLPPIEWFQDPGFTESTDLHIEDRHIYGHIALWGTCHIGINGACMMPPKTQQDYSQFLRHSVKTWCEDCERSELVRTGPLTAAPGHAPTRNVGLETVKAHYDDITYGFADVTIGEDQYGIWVNGKVRDTATEAQVQNFRASGLSGDWRRIDGNLELVAVLAVNTPGYPIVKGPLAHVASAENGEMIQDSLISAPRYFAGHSSTSDDIRVLKEATLQLLDESVRKSKI